MTSLDAPLNGAADWTRTAAPVTLYRFYNSADRLLYVGISEHGPGRWAKHRQSKPWWADVARSTMTTYATRAEAGAAEATAIRTERPLHNVLHNRGPRRLTNADLQAMTGVDVLTAIIEREAEVSLLTDQLAVLRQLRPKAPPIQRSVSAFADVLALDEQRRIGVFAARRGDFLRYFAYDAPFVTDAERKEFELLDPYLLRGLTHAEAVEAYAADHPDEVQP